MDSGASKQVQPDSNARPEVKSPMAEVLFNDNDDDDRFDMEEEENPLRMISLPSPSVTTVVAIESDATVMLGADVIVFEEAFGASFGPPAAAVVEAAEEIS